MLVQGKIRGHGDQYGAGLLGLPHSHAGFNAVLLGQLVAGQHNAVALLRVTEDGQRAALGLRTVKALHGGVEGVGVCMEDNTGHGISPRRRINVLVKYYNENEYSCRWEHVEIADTHSTQPRNLAYVGQLGPV